MIVTVITILFLTFMHMEVQAQTYHVTVSAGDLDRSESIVSFYLPDNVDPGVYRMRSHAGHTTIVQVDENGRGWFILDRLSAGDSRTYQLDASAVTTAATISYSIDSDLITFRSGSREVLSYYHGYNSPPAVLGENYRRGGYIHPVKSPNGVVLTNHLNLDSQSHGFGIWSAWPHTRFQGRTPDF